MYKRKNINTFEGLSLKKKASIKMMKRKWWSLCSVLWFVCLCVRSTEAFFISLASGGTEDSPVVKIPRQESILELCYTTQCELAVCASVFKRSKIMKKQKNKNKTKPRGAVRGISWILKHSLPSRWGKWHFPHHRSLRFHDFPTSVNMDHVFVSLRTLLWIIYLSAWRYGDSACSEFCRTASMEDELHTVLQLHFPWNILNFSIFFSEFQAFSEKKLFLLSPLATTLCSALHCRFKGACSSQWDFIIHQFTITKRRFSAKVKASTNWC